DRVAAGRRAAVPFDPRLAADVRRAAHRPRAVRLPRLAGAFLLGGGRQHRRRRRAGDDASLDPGAAPDRRGAQHLALVTPSELLAAEVARDGARPLFTFYDDATGARVELSVATTANWVAKTAGFLIDTYDVQP